MNTVLENLMKHRSIRQYKDEPVSEKELTEIIKAAQAAPNWNNFQLVSIIAVKDRERRKLLAELCGGQAYVAQAPVFLIFCADYYRVWLALNRNDEQMKKVLDDVDTVIVGAHEAAISAATAVVAAESLGLGTVCIGDVRLHPEEMIRRLDLPKYVFPVVGLCVGHAANDPGIRPRLPMEAIFFEDKYNDDEEKYIRQFDDTYVNYHKTREKNEKNTSWSEEISAFYKMPFHYPNTEAMLKKQGFLGGERNNKL